MSCPEPAGPAVTLELAELRAELLASGLVTDISTTTLWRWLAEDSIRPWQHQSWIFPRDPDFAAKAGGGPGPVPAGLPGSGARYR